MISAALKAAALALSYSHMPLVRRPGIAVRPEALDPPIKRVPRDRYVPGVGRVYQGGSVPGGLRRRRERTRATYIGPLHAYTMLPGGKLRAVPLYGERCMVMPRSEGNRACVQFNNTELLKHCVHDEYVSLGLGWHELPRNHFRFDEPVRW